MFLLFIESSISKEQQEGQGNVTDGTRKQQDSPNLPTPWPFDKFTRSAWEKIQIEPNWRDPDCISPKDHDEADLCQQRRMAKAADVTVYLNIGQIILNIAGLFALISTIRLTYRATRAAEKAAEISLEQSRIAKTAAEVPLRAFLTLSLNKVYLNGSVLISVKNEGATPANNVSVELSASDILGKETEVSEIAHGLPQNIQIMPRADAEFKIKFTEFDNFQSPRFSGVIQYRDWFGNDCKTSFWFESRGDIILKETRSHAS